MSNRYAKGQIEEAGIKKILNILNIFIYYLYFIALFDKGQDQASSPTCCKKDTLP